MNTEDALRGFAASVLSRDNVSTFCDVTGSTKRFSFYVSYVTDKYTDVQAQARARALASQFAGLMRDAGIEFYDCVPHRTVGRKQITWKVAVTLPRFS
jgi:hypothetical protein